MGTIEASRADRATTLKLADLAWWSVDPTIPNSPQMGALWSDPTSGPYGALMRVPAGFESPMHRHSRNERVIMISGTSIHWTEDESHDGAPETTAGDSMVMPAEINHVSAAAPGEDCIEFISQDRPFDFTMAFNAEVDPR